MLKLLLILGGVGVAALGSMVWVFAIGTASATYELRLTLRLSHSGATHRFGRPVGYQGLRVVWYQYSHRPDAFLVRLAFPGLSPLFYRFELRRDGPAPYQVFNTSYDYNWGHQWVGDFDAIGRVRSQTKPDKTGKVHTTVPPNGGQTLLWQANAALHRLAKVKTGSHYAIELNLQQNGVEQAVAR